MEVKLFFFKLLLSLTFKYHYNPCILNFNAVKVWKKSMETINNNFSSTIFFFESQEGMCSLNKKEGRGDDRDGERKVSYPINSSFEQRASFKREQEDRIQFPLPVSERSRVSVREDQWDIPCLTVRHAFSRRSIPKRPTSIIGTELR